MPRFTILRRTTLSCCLTLAVLTATCLVPLAAYAATDEEVVNPDARLEGYTPTNPTSPPTPIVVLKEPGGIAGSVVFLLVLIAITMGVMFINAKRSHLD